MWPEGTAWWVTRARARLRARLRVRVRVRITPTPNPHQVGVLAAIFMAERFERVIVRDMRRPAAFDEVLAAAVEAAPWVEGRIV